MGQITPIEETILDILNRLREATTDEVRRELTRNPHYSAVRVMLRVLEKRGHIGHREQRLRYVYGPVVPNDIRSGA